MPEAAVELIKDIELARGASNGSKKSWDALVDAYAPLVRGAVADYLRSLVGKPSEKEIGALTIEIFKSLTADGFAKLREYRGEASLGTFIAVLATARVQEYVRQEHEKTRFSNICSDSTGTLWRRSEKEADLAARGMEPPFDEALAALHPLDAVIIRMFYHHSLEYEEISALLRMNMGSVTKAMQTARANLAEQLAARKRRIEEFLY